MAGAFVGKWNVDLSCSVGLAEFGAACGFPPEKMEKMGNLSYSIEFSVDGETISATVAYDCDFPTYTYTFKLGDTFDYHAVDGHDAKLTVTMDGDKMVEDYTLGAASWQTIRQLESPDVMTAATSALGKTAIQKLRKQ